jgi:hypothetical protein
VARKDFSRSVGPSVISGDSIPKLGDPTEAFCEVLEPHGPYTDSV